MSLTKEEYLSILSLIELNYDAEYVNECYDDFCISMRNNIKQIKNLIEEHFEIIKEKEALEKALDKACELIKEAVSQDCTIFDEVTLDNLCWIIKRGELKEWLMKNVD